MRGVSRTRTLGASCRFLVCTTLFLRERKELLAGGALANFEVGHAFVVDFGREQEFNRVVPKQRAVLELHGREPLVEHFKGRLLSFTLEVMPNHEDRLPLSFGAQVPQSSLGRCRAGEVSS